MRKKGLIFLGISPFGYLGLVNKQICNENTTDRIKSLSVNCFQYFILSLYLLYHIAELGVVDHHVVDVKGLIYKPAQVAVIHWETTMWKKYSSLPHLHILFYVIVTSLYPLEPVVEIVDSLRQLS